MPVGPKTYNLDLARRRAETVAAYLAQQPSVDRDKLRVLSLGEAVPVGETTTRDGRAHHRRVEVRVYRLHWQLQRNERLSPSAHMGIAASSRPPRHAARGEEPAKQCSPVRLVAC